MNDQPQEPKLKQEGPLIGALSSEAEVRRAIHSDPGFYAAYTIGRQSANLELQRENNRLREALTRAVAVNLAHDRGWIYDDDNGSWYERTGLFGVAKFVCLDEALALHVGAHNAATEVARASVVPAVDPSRSTPAKAEAVAPSAPPGPP